MGNENSTAAPPRPPPADGLPRHYILTDNLLYPPFPEDLEVMYFGAGCFWGTEKGFWRLPGVYSTAVGFQAGSVKDPGYYDVCSGTTGHNEVTQVVFDPKLISIADLLHRFWDAHDPTQGDGQGNDRGTQYRSGIYCTTKDQVAVSIASREAMNGALKKKGFSKITTEIIGPDYHDEDRYKSCAKEGTEFPTFYYAEKYHQQYLAIPGNRQYCSAEPTGVLVPDYATWPGLDAEIAAKHTPFLPAGFWKIYVGSIKAPNAPQIWDKSVEKGADKLAKKIEKEFQKKRVKLEKTCDVIIRYCGGCGFQPKAEALKEFLEAADATKKIGLLQDPGTTGNMDVHFKTAPKTFVLIHSKKLNDDGFVDTKAKSDRLIKALAAVGQPVTMHKIAEMKLEEAAPATPKLDETAIKTKVDALIADNQVVVFSKTYCAFSKKAKAQFADLKIKYVVLELDEEEQGDAIQAYVAGKSGISTVPVVYVEQKLVGDSSATVAAKEAGAFDHLVTPA